MAKCSELAEIEGGPHCDKPSILDPVTIRVKDWFLMWILQFFSLDVQNSIFLLSAIQIYILAQNCAFLRKKKTAIFHDTSDG